MRTYSDDSNRASTEPIEGQDVLRHMLGAIAAGASVWIFNHTGIVVEPAIITGAAVAVYAATEKGLKSVFRRIGLA
jgi:hypothetical protein